MAELQLEQHANGPRVTRSRFFIGHMGKESIMYNVLSMNC